MSKPIKPNVNAPKEKWDKYYERYEKYLIRKRAMDKLYRQRHREKYLKQQAIYRFLNWHTLEEKRRIKFSDPANRQKEIERLYRYIDKNPFCNISKMEKLIKIYERTVSLDEQIGEDLTRYDLIAV